MIAVIVKATIVLLAGAAAAAALSRASASVRHFVWALALTGSVAVAVLTPVTPALSVPVMPTRIPPVGTTERVSAAPVAVPTSGPPIGVASQSQDTPPVTLSRDAWVSALWLSGAFIVAGWCLLGHLGLVRLLRRSQPVLDPEWQSLLSVVAAQMNVSPAVALRRTGAVGSPVTWGVRHPVILLPDEAESWPPARRRVVLVHELAHIARADYALQLVGWAACAIYWFHPLAWIAARRLRAESEGACDDRVLADGMPGVEYAGHLLDIARRSRGLRLAAGLAIGMARPSPLEGRLLAVMDETRERRRVPHRVRIAAPAAIAILILPVAALRPVERAATPLVRQTAVRTAVAAPVAPERARPATRVSANPIVLPDSTIELSVPAKPGDELYIDLETGGDVAVEGWDRPMVQVRGTLGGPNWRETEVTLERTARGATLRAEAIARRNSFSTSHDFVVRVPRQYDIRINSAGGGLAIANVEGEFDGQTGGGGFEITGARGRASLSTGGGEVHVTDSDLTGRVSTGGGVVRFSRVRGGLKGSSGSGPVIYSESGQTAVSSRGIEGAIRGDLGDLTIRGDRISNTASAKGVLHIQKAGGDVDLEGAPNGVDLTTGGGQIRIGPSAGFVSASTGGGDVTIGPVAGSVRAGTGAGTVQIRVVSAGGREQTVEARSGNGRIDIELPADFDGRFSIETAYTRRNGPTRIDSDWSLSAEPVTDWETVYGTPRKFVRAYGVAGNGRGLVEVKTVNGDVVIRRGP